jgi:hypothetical protein
MNQKQLDRLLKLDPIQWGMVCASLTESDIEELREAMRVRFAKREPITAHHEAGHAVAHVMLDVDFDHVIIVPDDDSAGRARQRARAAQRAATARYDGAQTLDGPALEAARKTAS